MSLLKPVKMYNLFGIRAFHCIDNISLIPSKRRTIIYPIAGRKEVWSTYCFCLERMLSIKGNMTFETCGLSMAQVKMTFFAQQYLTLWSLKKYWEIVLYFDKVKYIKLSLWLCIQYCSSQYSTVFHCKCFLLPYLHKRL